MKLFEENVSIFSQDNPIGSVLLESVDLNYLQACITKGYKNLRKEFDGKTRYFHSSTDPKKEADRWFSQLKLEQVDVLYIFGIGLGYYYHAAKDWLHQSPERQIVFLEDDLSVIYYFLKDCSANQILSDPQAHLYFFRGIEDQGTFDRITWKFCGKQIEVSALKLYCQVRREFFILLRSKLLYESSMKNDLFDEFQKCGAPYFKNFYANLMKLPKSYNAQSLFGKFKNIPAIICGAGPSLKKNVNLLKSLEEKALIFAGGSAMNAVNAAHLLPHFGAGIDPNPDQYVRYESNQAFEVPFFYRNRLEHRALMTIHGSRIYVKGAGGYPIADWFDKALNIQGPVVEEGHNVVNFCAEIAAALGCNPIIFIGLDLAYSDMRAYAKGVIQNALVLENEIAQAPRFELRAHKQKNIFGKDVYTIWKWVAESEWITQFAKRHEEIIVLNSSEGGIGIEEVENMALAEAIQKYLKKSWDLSNKVYVEIQNAPLKVSIEQIIELLKTLQKSLHQSFAHLRELASSPDFGMRALAEYELREEVAYQAILEVFENVYQRFRPEDEQGKFQFLMETARLNLALIQSTLANF